MRAEVAPSFVWAPELTEPGGRLVLSEAEGRHLARVCRARVGDRVTVTDGRGGVASARVTSARPVAVAVETLKRERQARRAVLLCGAPEGHRADWLVEKLAELGVAVFQPVDCERERWERSSGRNARWRRLAVAALKQSRRCFLLEIRDPVSLPEALESVPGAVSRWLADPEGVWAAELKPPGGEVAGFVGPSPGLSPAEQARLGAAGFGRIRLSDARLRTETAALVWAGWWSGGFMGSQVATRPAIA